MGHGPAHPAPPPPKWGFVSFLAILAAATFGIFTLLRPVLGESFLFVVGFICFIAPLLGWATTVCFGKWLPRMGDWLPVGALLVSFCCGATIFKVVVLEGYKPTYAKEYRFNWFSIAGDGATTATGPKRLNDTEYAIQRGIPAVIERARAADKAHPTPFDTLEAKLQTPEAKPSWDDFFEGLATTPRGDNAPDLKSFNPRAKDAASQYLALPRSLRVELHLWLAGERMKSALASAATNEVLVPRYLEFHVHNGFEQLNGEVYGTKQTWHGSNANDVFKPATGSVDALHGLMRVIQHDHQDSLALQARGESQKITTGPEYLAFLVAFADAEQAWHNWCYTNITDPRFDDNPDNDLDPRSPLYTDVTVDLRRADDKNFQAFAVGIYIDNVTAVTILMVTLLAFLIHLFSVGYMYGEIRYTRFMATINLFTAGMIGLVLANNFLWLFICWEIMGLCSYLLIGHYFEKKSAQEASMKAFFTTRIADTFMFIGMMMIFAATGTFVFAGGHDVTEAMRSAGSYMGAVEYAGPGSFFHIIGSKELFIGGVGATAIGLLCFIGPAGKSAQFPFHVWLPDAMEGPTPVSAMIHAACMVSAGVYLTARLFPLFTPDTLQIIAVIGGFTALMAGTIGLVQTDLKKVLAYSTISQLGYMFMGIGVGAWEPALFHMLTHAFFKALMFLGSGSVILGCHHEQEMTRMGGLWKKMPITAITFWVGNASIIGLPFLFAGYYSKEAILTDAVIFGKASGNMLPYIFGALGAGLTTFYMCRLMWLTFHGKPRDKELFDHVKESPWTVVTPLIVIALGALVISWPIGAHDDSVNLGLTNFVESENAGPKTQKGEEIGHVAQLPPQAPNESWLAVRMRKPASIYSEDFLRSEYSGYVKDKASLGHEVERDRLDVLYADGHGRPSYAGVPAWKEYDLTVVDPEKFYPKKKTDEAGSKKAKPESGHGGGHEAFAPTNENASLVDAESADRSRAFSLATVSADSLAGPADEHAAPAHSETATGHADEPHPEAAHGSPAEHTEHAHGLPTLDSHAVHAYHEAHHDAHMLAFIVALIMLAGGIALSVYFYLGPLAGKDWVGHHGFRFRVKQLLKQSYRVDNFYFATIIRLNRWLRQFFSWFDRVFVDGFINLWGTATRWMCKAAALTDYWAVDGSVRGSGNVTFWGSRQASRAVTGRIQDYVFMLVAGVVILFMLLVMLK